MTEISPLIIPNASSLLWYLDGINDSKLLHLSGLIKQAEHAFEVGRVRFPCFRECLPEEAQMSHPSTTDGKAEHWRLVRDLWRDGIDVCAYRLLHTYKQLPCALSAEDAIYCADGKELRSDYVWTVAVYGGNVDMLANTAEKVGVAISLRSEVSERVFVRGRDNRLFSPSVAIMDVTLIDGGYLHEKER